jgi:ATP-binding cassette subfamily B protein
VSVFTATVRHSGRRLPVIGGAVLVDTACVLALPAVLGRAVDATAAGKDWRPWVAWAAALMAASVVSEIAGAYATTRTTADTTAWLRHRLLARVLGAGPVAADAHDTGDLVSRVCGNTVDASRAGPGAVTAAASALPPLGALVLLAGIDPWLALAFLAGLAGVAAVLRTFTRRTSEALSTYLTVQGRIAGRLTESLAGIRTVAAAGTVDRETGRVLADLPELRGAGFATWRVLGRSSMQGTIVGPITLAAVLAVGGYELSRGRITAGALFAAGRYATLGIGLGSLTGILGMLARSRAGVARVGEILALPMTEYGDQTLPPGHGRLEMRAVSVPGVLHDVDLDLPGGSVVAVVGHSGSGKSVLAALAARLRDPDAGEVRLDGVPLPGLGREALRQAVGCAFERPALVGPTVGAAIGLGLPSDRVEAAAAAARADGFVRRLPQGYDTPLADTPMSGGEAQRLGLARAWPAERLLVLDDATSSLDTATEALVSDALLAREARTRLIVTHRAATAARADLVVWLEAGRVRARGTHRALWRDPEYREVFAS